MRFKIWIALAPVTAVLLSLPGVASTAGQKPQPRATARARTSSIEGTWRMISFRYGGKGAPLQKLGVGRVMLKHITPGHFTWVDYQAKTKKVVRMAGGTFTLHGSAYQETVEYGSGEDIQALLGRGQVFNDTIIGQRWHHQGKLSTGLEIEEDWQRVPS